MQVEILGSGGAITTPRPLCQCRVCREARVKGVPYSRSGPSVFVHGPDVLIDTPEESKFQIDRSRIQHINAGFYSHWHPDHVMGRRVWETMNGDFRGWPRQHTPTDVYLPQQVAQDFRTWLGGWEHMAFLERQGYVRLIELRDGERVTIGDVTIEPFRLAQEYVYAFLFESEDTRVLIEPDETLDWIPDEHVCGVDLAVLPMGVNEFNPLTGERRIAREHPVLAEEATFEETLEILRVLNARRVILTHIEEPDDLSYDDLLVLQGRLQADGLPVEFAYDTMLIDVGEQ